MRTAIVGTGFSGLAVGWSLLKKGAQVVFYEDPLCEGASTIASGLLHPYVGEQCKRSWKASEGLAATLDLLSVAEHALGFSVAERTGIMRIAFLPEHDAMFSEHAKNYQDIEKIDEKLFFIKSGLTIHANKYVEGLKKACSDKGDQFIKEKVLSLKDLVGYSQVVVAAGSQVAQFFPELTSKTSRVKGQLIKFRHAHTQTCPMVGKGYLIKLPDEEALIIGSTYERNFETNGPDLEIALKNLNPRLESFGIDKNVLDVVEVRSGVRVNRIGHYYPIACKMGKSAWVITGMGSRGLLYHAYVGEQLAEAIWNGTDSLADPELSVII